MKYCIVLFMSVMVFSLPGCRTEVKETKDSVKVQTELPKVEIKKAPDLDPRTDDDIDIKTPKSDSK